MDDGWSVEIAGDRKDQVFNAEIRRKQEKLLPLICTDTTDWKSCVTKKFAIASSNNLELCCQKLLADLTRVREIPNFDATEIPLRFVILGL